MPEYGFSLTRIFPCKGRIEEFVLIRENADRRKPVFWRILHSVSSSKFNEDQVNRFCLFYLIFSETNKNMDLFISISFSIHQANMN